MTTKLIGAAALAAATLLPNAASASTQGSLGATSTGSVSIQASVPGRVRISGLQDINFANVDPASAATRAQDVCVWSNTSTRGYNILATGSGAGSAFTLSSGTLPPVSYTVQWEDSAGQASGSALTAGTALTGLTSVATSTNCSGGPSASASLVVAIGSADLETMIANTSYTGTLTLVVAPE